MKTRITPLAAVFIASIASTAHADFKIKTVPKGGMVNWTVTVDADTKVNSIFAIHSIHIIGQGAKVDPLNTPEGWKFTGQPEQGVYSWERTDKANVAGTWDFGITYGGKLEVCHSLGYDLAANPNAVLNIKAPKTPDKSNWAYTPAPAPGSIALLGAAAMLCLRRRRD